jgi:hypothetical protein
MLSASRTITKLIDPGDIFVHNRKLQPVNSEHSFCKQCYFYGPVRCFIIYRFCKTLTNNTKEIEASK